MTGGTSSVNDIKRLQKIFSLAEIHEEVSHLWFGQLVKGVKQLAQWMNI
jgi:hypothetical protein